MKIRFLVMGLAQKGSDMTCFVVFLLWLFSCVGCLRDFVFFFSAGV